MTTASAGRRTCRSVSIGPEQSFVDFFVHIFENIEDHLFYTGLLFEKFFDGLHRNFGGKLVGEMKLSGGNAAERHTFQLFFCRQLQTETIARGQQFLVCFVTRPLTIGPTVCST